MSCERKGSEKSWIVMGQLSGNDNSVCEFSSIGRLDPPRELLMDPWPEIGRKC